MAGSLRTTPVEIVEAGLLLRPWRPEDADAVFRACQDPDIQRWTTVPRPYLREHAQGFVGPASAQAWVAGTAANFGVFPAHDRTGDEEELLGSIGLVRLNQPEGWAEIGYWTAPWSRGTGVATRAARALARWGFDTLGLTRLVWRAEIGNHPSRAVAARLGVRVEGVLRQALARPTGGWADGWTGSLFPSELREAADPLSPADRLVVRRAATFSRPQPQLTALLPSGGAVRLRAPAERDLDAIVAACQDPESVRWTTVPDPYQRRDAEYFAFLHAPGQWARGDGITCAITDADDGYCGSMELRVLADPGVADVGFLVAPWARGRGYAPTALRELCQWAFDELDLRRIEWRAYVGNTASWRVAEKVGFTVEGVTRGGCVGRGALHDAWTASLIRGDI